MGQKIGARDGIHVGYDQFGKTDHVLCVCVIREDHGSESADPQSDYYLFKRGDEGYAQYDLFTDPAEMEREHRMQKAMLDIKEKFGKNAILKGMNLDSRGKTIERNRQIGGHRSGE